MISLIRVTRRLTTRNLIINNLTHVLRMCVHIHTYIFYHRHGVTQRRGYQERVRLVSFGKILFILYGRVVDACSMEWRVTRSRNLEYRVAFQFRVARSSSYFWWSPGLTHFLYFRAVSRTSDKPRNTVKFLRTVYFCSADLVREGSTPILVWRKLVQRKLAGATTRVLFWQLLSYYLLLHLSPQQSRALIS